MCVASAHSKKLVAYLGLNPSVSKAATSKAAEHSSDMEEERCEPCSSNRARSCLEVNNPLQKWGLAIAARRGRNKAAVAVARKLCVALWHVLIGHVIGALERLDTLKTKLSKFATEIGPAALRAFGYHNKAEFVEKKTLCATKLFLT